MTDPLIYLPFDSDANSDAPPSATLGTRTFAYVGQALTLSEFRTYVATYLFGTIPPDYIVLHHTAVPATSAAPYGDPAKFWDAGEAGMTGPQIKTKRLGQLHNIMAYYRDTLGWDAGPHLFIDDRYIYLFTPMNTVGIHAAWGNSTRINGKLHYSIGIEVVGYYEKAVWPDAVARNVGGAVTALCARLRIPLVHTVGPGGISSHRDYNKPTCPGKAITEAYYMDVITRTANPVPPDPFAGWGDVARPQGVALTFAIPRRWQSEGGKLGKCLAAEQPLIAGTVQEFERGVITWHRANDSTRVAYW